MTQIDGEVETTSGYAMRGRQGKIIEALGRDIVGGRYRPGDLLPREAELTEAYTASRTSLREAIKVLAAKGLVETRQKVGTRVRERELWSVFDTDILRWQTAGDNAESVMRDLIELRQILEPAAARLAAGRAEIEDLRRIGQVTARMAASAEEHEQYAASDVDFHLAIYAASHNELLGRFGRLVADFMRLSFDVQQRARAQETVDFADDAQAHAVVYQDINRGDATAAAESMLAVVLDGKSALIEALNTLSLRDNAVAADHQPRAS